ncbi:MAG TPA: roadblock/LC7 domain-containing protein [Ktedonobacterales bacterium]|nr:roadblock/LC7 domain-containing protein [Ktedonobacterales bacterium]
MPAARAGEQWKGEGVESYLRRLMEIEGVSGALIVGKDGLVIASTLDRDHEEMLGAMAAACFDASARYIEQVGMGAVRFALFETPGGVVQIADGGEMLLVAQSSVQAGMGRIRMEIIQMVRQLSQQISPR